MANKPKTEWEVKFLREFPFMPFGSLMNAYGLINKGKEIKADDFLLEAVKIWAFCQDIVDDVFEEIAEINEKKITKVDFAKAEKLGQKLKEIDKREEQEKIDDINDTLNKEKAEQDNIPF